MRQEHFRHRARENQDRYKDLERDTESELAAVDRGETGAFDRFVEYFRPKIFQYSWLMCGHC